MQKNKWPATFSIGAVTFINPPASLDEIIEKADRLMYFVKNNGKNRFEHRTGEYLSKHLTSKHLNRLLWQLIDIYCGYFGS